MASRFELARVKVTDANTGVFEKYQFLFSEGDEEQVFYGDYFGPEDLDPKCAIRSLELENITLVPVEVFYPLVRLGWTRAGPDFASTRHFVKKPRLGNYDLDDTPELWPSTEVCRSNSRSSRKIILALTDNTAIVFSSHSWPKRSRFWRHTKPTRIPAFRYTMAY